MILELGIQCPLLHCDWAAGVGSLQKDTASDRPDEHDYLVLYQAIVEHLEVDHSAVPGGPE